MFGLSLLASINFTHLGKQDSLPLQRNMVGCLCRSCVLLHWILRECVAAGNGARIRCTLSTLPPSIVLCVRVCWRRVRLCLAAPEKDGGRCLGGMNSFGMHIKLLERPFCPGVRTAVLAKVIWLKI